MKILIDIGEDLYTRLFDNGSKLSITDQLNLGIALRKGTPLPKEHGRLADIDEMVKYIVEYYGTTSIYGLPDSCRLFVQKFICKTPTILDADIGYKMKNYAFFTKEEEK